MKKQWGSHEVVVLVLALVVLAGALGYIFWNNNLRSDKKSNDAQASEETRDNEKNTELSNLIVRTSTLGDWTVSLDVPEPWEVKTKQDSIYNYDTRTFEEMKNTTYVHPSGKVEVNLIQMPFFNADGTCGPGVVKHLHKEPMHDSRLTYVEMIMDNGGFFLSPASSGAADTLTEDFTGCSSVQDLIAKDGLSLVGTNGGSKAKQPFVGVRIRPAFVNEEAYDWDPQRVLDFLATDEYKEAKTVAKSLKI